MYQLSEVLGLAMPGYRPSLNLLTVLTTLSRKSGRGGGVLPLHTVYATWHSANPL